MNNPAPGCTFSQVVFIGLLLAAVIGRVQAAADETGFRKIDSMLQEGRRLTDEQAADLETKVSRNPRDLDGRLRLVGYYGHRVDLSARGEEARRKRNQHVLGLIKHDPGSAIFSGTYFDHAMRSVLLAPGEALEQAAKLWTRAVKEHERDARVLGNAASFFLTYPNEESGDRDQTEALLRRAQNLDPGNPRWPMGFFWLYVHDQRVAEGLTEQSKQAFLERAFKYLETSYVQARATLKTSTLSPDASLALSQSLHFLQSEMPGAAFAAEETALAKKYAEELLESAHQAEKGSADSDVIHNANVILGWVALKEGKIDQAKQHLVKAGDLPRSFGPNIELALEQLKNGIRKSAAPKTEAIEFTKFGDYAVGDFPVAVIAGDFDGDRDIDLAVANRGAMERGVARDSGTVSVLLNRGDGRFADAVSFTVGNMPTSLTAGDFDGDGDLDLAVASSGSRRISVLRNDGDGVFVITANLAPGAANCLASGDFDGDGRLDLAVGGGLVGYTQPEVTLVYALALLNKGNGAFEPVADGRFIAGGATSLSVGDVDGDGDLDLILGIPLPPPASVVILTNNGQGTFIEGQKLAVEIFFNSVASGDFDGDGDLDLAVTIGIRPGQVAMLLNNGQGDFKRGESFECGRLPFHIAVGDIDLDGDLDLAVANIGIGPSDGDVAVLLNNGDATFERLGNFPVRSGPRAIVVADVDGDGDLDLVTANPGTDTVSVLLNSRIP